MIFSRLFCLCFSEEQEPNDKDAIVIASMEYKNRFIIDKVMKNVGKYFAYFEIIEKYEGKRKNTTTVGQAYLNER